MSTHPHIRESDSTGVSLSRTEGLGQYYDVAGRRTVVIGVEGGDSEVWVYPLKAAYELKFLLDEQGSFRPLRDLIDSFEVAPEASIARYEVAGGHLEQRIIAPVDSPCAVFAFRLTGADEVRLKASFKSELKLMWPADSVGQAVRASADPASGGWAIESTVSGDAEVAGWDSGDSPALSQDGCFEQTTLIRDGKWHAFVVAASCDGLDCARQEFNLAVTGLEGLYARTVSYYRDFLRRTATVESSDPDLERAFLWAKIGVEKSVICTPGMGCGFVAGYSPSWGGGRPGFGWYFGRDSSWTGFAANDYGDFGSVRENIRLLAKYQVKDGPDRGKIYHELSAADDRLTEHSYCFVAGDSTPFFVVDVANYYLWTADAGFVREMWPHVLLALEWCYRMDVDGDLLIDNPPAGHQWYDYGEKNMVDLVAIWAKALQGAALLGELMGDERAAQWKKHAEDVVLILNEDFWNEGDGYLHDRKLPDGSMSAITTANPTIPLLWRMIEPAKAERAIRRLGSEDLTVPWGMRTNSNLDDIYKPEGYHEGTVWPLTTGWASLAAFANGDAELGWHHLKANMDLTTDWALGYITEVLDGDAREPSGSVHQAWSEAMVVMPVVEGLLGLSCNWPAKTITLAPRLPEALTWLALRNLTIGEARIGIVVKRADSSLSLVIDVEGADISVVFAPPVPPGSQLTRVRLNGQTLTSGRYSVEPEGYRRRVCLSAAVSGRAEVQLDWGACPSFEHCADKPKS